MKPGDLVRINSPCDLDYFSEPISEEVPYPPIVYERIGEDDLMVVLDVRKIPKRNFSDHPESMIHILLPNGRTGWVYNPQLRVVR